MAGTLCALFPFCSQMYRISRILMKIAKHEIEVIALKGAIEDFTFRQ